MPDKVIFSAPYGAVLADSAVPCVIIQLLGFANRVEFTDLMERGLAHYSSHSTPAHPWGWVGDVRQMGAIPQAVQQWLADDWNPRAFAAGVREVSIVDAENVQGQLAAQRYAQTTQAEAERYEIEARYYATLEDAKQGAQSRATR